MSNLAKDSPNQRQLVETMTSQIANVPRDYVQSESSLLEDAELAISNLSHQDVQSIRETEELFKQQVDYMIQIDHLRRHIPDMKTISCDAQKLSSLVDSSFMLVEEVCGKFRQNDLAKSRLEDSLSKIGDILDLETCRDGIINAMKLNNYEEAAIHVKRFLSIDQLELQKTIAIICNVFQQQRRVITSANTFGSRALHRESDIDTRQQSVIEKEILINPKLMNSALKDLDEAKCRLLHICQEKITQAIKDNNTRDIERFFKLFPMLNEHHDGLQRYSQYLKSRIVSTQLDLTLGSKDINQADKLAALFESVAKLIDSHQPMIETYYGPGHLIVVARVIQNECDRISRKILEQFRNETNLQQVAKIVRSSSNLSIIVKTLQQNVNNSQCTSSLNLTPNSNLDPRTVDKILNEMSAILSRSEVYLTFIADRIRQDIDSKEEDEAQRKNSRIELYNMINLECELNHLIQEVGGIYVMLEQYYLNESSKKAMVMDQIDMDPSFASCFVSSMLDDIFFLVKKCTKRAIATKGNEVFCAIINHCVTLLESTFCQILEDRLKNQQYFTSFSAKNLDFSQAYNALQSGRYLQSVTDQRKSNAQYFSALNNLDKACDYIKTLRVILDSDVRKLKPSALVTEKHHVNQLEKSITCLNDLSQLANKFSSIINSTLYQLFNTSLRSRIKTELKLIVDENPDLIALVTATNHNELSSLAKNLLKTSDTSLEENLLPENYARLVSITSDFLLSAIKSIK